jgi:hypothetical protein
MDHEARSQTASTYLHAGNAAGIARRMRCIGRKASMRAEEILQDEASLWSAEASVPRCQRSGHARLRVSKERSKKANRQR